MEEQLHEVTVQLGHVEEQRLVTLKENAAMKVCGEIPMMIIMAERA